jgi:hypothetical protein
MAIGLIAEGSLRVATTAREIAAAAAGQSLLAGDPVVLEVEANLTAVPVTPSIRMRR